MKFFKPIQEKNILLVEFLIKKFALKSNLVKHQATHNEIKVQNVVFVQKEDILKQNTV